MHTPDGIPADGVPPVQEPVDQSANTSIDEVAENGGDASGDDGMLNIFSLFN